MTLNSSLDLPEENLVGDFDSEAESSKCKLSKKQILLIAIPSAVLVLICIIVGVVVGCKSKKVSGKPGYDDLYVDIFSDEIYGVYLSDLEYENCSEAGWIDKDYPKGHLEKDKTITNTKITVKIGNGWRSFDKGLFTHGPANVYYNLKNYNYKYMTAYVGLDQTSTQRSDGVKFYVFTSNDDILDDNTKWELKTEKDPPLMCYENGNLREAESLVVDIAGAKYLKLNVDQNKHGSADYAVWADAKLTNSFSGNELLDLFDEKIKARNDNVEDNAEFERFLLQREFINRVGQDNFRKFTEESAGNTKLLDNKKILNDNKEVLDWLLNDLDALREYIIGGKPGYGNFYQSLTVLSDLYRNYKSDLSNTTLLHNKWKPERTYGDMYRTMMFATALVFDIKVASWLQAGRVENQGDPLRRYAIYRYLHNTGRFIATRNETDGTPLYETQSLFESLTVEEMRWIMYDIIDDESIIWLNDYVQTKINAAPARASALHTPHSYIAYTSPNYGNPIYYDEGNKDYFNDLFKVDDREHPGKTIGMWNTKYIVPGGVDHQTYTMTISRGTASDKIQKVWFNFRNKFGTGCVCGGISKSGTNIRGARGVPCTVIGQPGHAAMLAYGKNSQGKGYWGIDNDVSGWTVSTKNERHLLGWGNEKWQRTHATIVYFALAQDALNDYDNYLKAEENVMHSRVFENDPAKREQLCERALSFQPINLDAWYGLIQAYEAKGVAPNKYIDLAARIADIMVGYPLPLYDLFKVIEPLLKGDQECLTQLNFIKSNALALSRVLPNTAIDKTLLPGVARGEAAFLLGQEDMSIASFSFDGENANSIVWAERFNGNGLRFRYSLDNKKTWKEVSFTADEPHVHKLTPAELAVLSEENDIYVYVVGVSNPEQNSYKIDISPKQKLPNTLFANDYENKIFGLTEEFEWQYVEIEGETQSGDQWTSYSDANPPDCTGNKKVAVRLKGKSGLPPSDSQTFTFTANEENDKRKYVSISRLSIAGYSSQSKDSKRPNYAVNAIDGNINTYWHTDYAENILTTGNNPYLIIKIDKQIYFSGLDLAQRQYNPQINIYAKNINVSVSTDNKNWKQVESLLNLEAVDDLRTIALETSQPAQYVKIHMDTYGIFTTVSMVNIYEEKKNK